MTGRKDGSRPNEAQKWQKHKQARDENHSKREAPTAGQTHRLAPPKLNPRMHPEELRERLNGWYDCLAMERISREAGLTPSQLARRARHLVDRARRVLPENPPIYREQLAIYLALYGRCLKDAGMIERALDAYRESLDYAGNLHNTESYLTCLLQLGRAKEAADIVNALSAREIESEHESFAIAILELAFAYGDFARRVHPRQFKTAVWLLGKYPPLGQKPYRIDRRWSPERRAHLEASGHFD